MWAFHFTEDTNSFTPASDGIVHVSQLTNIASLLTYSKAAVRIIIISFIISLLYNFVGLSFAVTGHIITINCGYPYALIHNKSCIVYSGFKHY
nr:hypothetical protein [Bacteroidota bacterium]